MAVAYDCTHQNKVFLLLMRNALYIPELDINLLNAVIINSYENNNSFNFNIFHHGAESNAQMMANDLNNWIINGNISMVIESTIQNNHPCPLFTTILSDLEDNSRLKYLQPQQIVRRSVFVIPTENLENITRTSKWCNRT